MALGGPLGAAGPAAFVGAFQVPALPLRGLTGGGAFVGTPLKVFGSELDMLGSVEA